MGSLIAFISAMIPLCVFFTVTFALWFHEAQVPSTSARRHIYVITLAQSPYSLCVFMLEN